MDYIGHISRIGRIRPIKNQHGVSTMEVLIALAVFSMGTGAIISVVFGSEYLGLDGSLSRRSIELVQKNMQESLLQANERGVSGIADISENPEVPFTLTRTLKHISECAADSTVAALWTAPNNRVLNTTVNSRITDSTTAMFLDRDCATIPPTNPWDNPAWYLPLPEAIAGLGNKITNVEVFKREQNTYAVLTSAGTDLEESDFWIYNVTNPSATSLIISTPDHGLNTGPGLYDADVFGSFAYVVGGNTANGTLQTINISDLTDPYLFYTYSLGSGLEASHGWRVFAHQNKLFVGRKYAAGHELFVFDIGLNPGVPSLIRSVQLNTNVEDMVVRRQMVGGVEKVLVYLATSANSKEVRVIDATSPASGLPEFGPGFDAAGTEHATSLYLYGPYLILGRQRTTAGRPEMYILDASLPQSGFTVKASWKLNLAPSQARVTSLAASGNLLFIGISDENKDFAVWDISNLLSPVLTSTINMPQAVTDLEYVDNIVYASLNDSNGFRIVHDE